ncbi:hypothetical protein [Streptomyces antarcticus]|uniref:hypothetical protein n=1 Tax=Streptomyces antarcticus TaxID=2996458 RepID=UPI002D1E368C|nr:hypothetical protein [Streptomyces sp. H34-AA3]
MWPALVTALLLVPGTAAAQGPVDSAAVDSAAAGAATPDRPSYDVALRGDADGSHWSGRQTVSFRNAARTPLRSVDVCLWGNGADGCGAPGSPSPVRVGRVAGGTPRPLTVGCTALRIDLSAPLRYGQRTSVSFDVAITIPDRVHRFGRDGAHRYLGGGALPVEDRGHTRRGAAERVLDRHHVRRGRRSRPAGRRRLGRRVRKAVRALSVR